MYSVDVCIPAGDVEYKYMIDNWAAQEDLVDDAQSGLSCAAVTDAATYANRMTTAGSTTADTYGSCYTCEEQAANALGCTDSAAVNYNENATNDDGSCLFAVTFRVDMANFDGPAYSVVNVNGSFNGWCGTCNPLDDSNGDGIWEATLNLPAGTIEYKFTLDGWTQQEEFAPGGACTTTIDGFTNRSLLVDGAEDLTAVCWNSCDVCVASPGCTDQEAVNYDSTALNEDGSCQYAVTFQVDMSQYGLTETDGVFLNGAYNGWWGAAMPWTTPTVTVCTPSRSTSRWASRNTSSRSTAGMPPSLSTARSPARPIRRIRQPCGRRDRQHDPPGRVLEQL